MKKITTIIAISLCLATASFSSEFEDKKDFHDRQILMIKRDLKPIESINSQPFIDLRDRYSGLASLFDNLYAGVENLKTQHHSILERLRSLSTEIDSQSGSPKSEISTPHKEEELLSNGALLSDNWIQAILKQLVPIDHVDPTLFQRLADQQETQAISSVYIEIFQELEALKTNNASIIRELKDLEEILATFSEPSSPIAISHKQEEKKAQDAWESSSAISFRNGYMSNSYMEKHSFDGDRTTKSPLSTEKDIESDKDIVSDEEDLYTPGAVDSNDDDEPFFT